MSLVEFLNQNGYIQIPLSRSGVGHFHVVGSLNGRQIEMIVDTGAANTFFSFDLAREMDLRMTKSSETGGGAGAGELEIHTIHEASFLLGDITPQMNELFALDMSHANEALTQRGASPVDGILGVDVFEAHQAVIDYASCSLYLKV